MLDFLKSKKGKLARAEIHLKLRELSQLFNSMDPSPFRDKDLDADAEAFIEGWALEFHVSAPLTLVVHLEQPPGSAAGDDPRELIESAVQHFFLNKAVAARRELRAQPDHRGHHAHGDTTEDPGDHVGGREQTGAEER